MIVDRRRLFVVLCIVLALTTAPRILVEAQEDGEEQVEDLDGLKEAQRQAAREAALSASQIDVFDANVQEVTAALDELAAFVATHQARVDAAEQAHGQAVEAVEAARERTREIELEQGVLRERMTELAVTSFTGEQASTSSDITELALSDDPGESARFIHLLEIQTGSLSDGLDQVRALEVEAELVTAAMRLAETDAAVALLAVEERNSELSEALALQERIVVAAEIRLEAQLAEAAFLEERDQELAIRIADEQYAINERVAATARRNGIEIPDPVRLEDISRLEFYEEGVLPEPEVDPETGLVESIVIPLDVQPFFAIEVHTDIEEQARLLFDEAYAADIDLAGWGYRPIQRQIELRAAHCGGTEADIWHKPAFECAPPTARPGFSKHEQGRAIDFTFQGQSITSHQNAGFIWLAANAPKYGFVNLASEPWHWSIAEGEERLPAQ